MDISYLFPIFEDNDAKVFFDKFLASKFFSSQKNVQILTYVLKNDKRNLNALSEIAKKCKIIKVNIEENTFTYNDIFKKAINNFKGDILLLGDAKIKNIELVFKKCLEKYESGANIVFVKKKYSGIKKFFNNALQFFYNFFIKIFTGKKDRFNIVSLGLYDKNIIDFFQTLPDKCCFLKNTKDLFGFCSKTIYIDEKVEILKLNFKKRTTSLLFASISLSLFVTFLILIILFNILFSNLPTIYNLIGIFGLFISFFISSLLFPKHFYDIRNESNVKELKTKWWDRVD